MRYQQHFAWSVLLRLCHWSFALSVVVLVTTGFYIHFPWTNTMLEGGSSFPVATMHYIHFIAAFVFTAALLSTADAACYAAKDKGRNRIHVHRPGDGEMARRHGEMRWVSRITRALEEDRFQLYYQAIVPMGRDGPGRHFEVLLRMLDEDEKEIIPPMAFIPAAERYNLMHGIDRWVIRNVFAVHGQIFKHGNKGGTCAINLSAASLCDEQFLDYTREQLKQYAVDPRTICFEVTETAAIVNLSSAVELMQELKKTGCRFSLDDFGSGLSSFTYLKNLPVDYLKIDGMFVRNMACDSIDFAMVQAINNVGHVMGLKTIAEFVENDGILDKLGGIGVDFVQGYLLGRPRPLVELIG
jgi:EAL domain-containing protein (putative c-di-GMP-specific phosphodiesterase class I)